MTTFESKVSAAIEQHRGKLLRHRLYERLQTLEDLKVFMEVHVFAVWDFMSLLKALQLKLTCVRTPWLPEGNGQIRRLVNEIVLGEESDTLPEGGATSHFELYLQAMREAGANTRQSEKLIRLLETGQSVTSALESCGAALAVRRFVGHTFAVVEHGKPHEIAAAFTFGREDLIPEMFTELVHSLERQFPGKLKTLRYYLDRHIQLDGDEHGAMGLQMVDLLCAGLAEREDEAIAAAVSALQARLKLWDAISEMICEEQPIQRVTAPMEETS